MQYFMYSPLEMDEAEAYESAYEYLEDNKIVYVTTYSIKLLVPPEGERPRAIANTYLVRVEQDGSLRTVHTALT